MRGGYALDRGAVLRRELLGRVTNEDPLRRILPLVNVALEDLSPRMRELYVPIRRASISPEKLLRALLLQAFNSVRSERQLIEQLKYNLLFRCSPRTATVKVFFSDEHFLVGRTLIKAFASMKSFKPRTKAPTGTWGRRTRRSRWTGWERR
jgi:Transposase domain (DUF772)